MGYVEVGLFTFGSHLTLCGCFLGFDIPTSLASQPLRFEGAGSRDYIPTSSFVFIGNVFYNIRILYIYYI